MAYQRAKHHIITTRGLLVAFKPRQLTRDKLNLLKKEFNHDATSIKYPVICILAMVPKKKTSLQE